MLSLQQQWYDKAVVTEAFMIFYTDSFPFGCLTEQMTKGIIEHFSQICLFPQSLVISVNSGCLGSREL